MGNASRCQHITKKKHITRETCFKIAIAAGGNVINFRKHRCYVKKCEDDDDLKITGKLGGFDIYQLRGKEKFIGLKILKFYHSHEKRN